MVIEKVNEKSSKKKLGLRVSKIKIQGNIAKSRSTQKISLPKKTISKKTKNYPTLKLKSENDIAMDFAMKAYKRFDKLVKSIVLFGSTVKKNTTAGSDIDIIMIVDDASILWDQKLITWYRDELNTLLNTNPYKENLHINTVKLTTFWQDLIRGDPVILNILRYGEPLIDFAGFFEPLRFLLILGKIKPSPEAIYNCLQRAPIHIQRSKASELNSIEGLYWAMVDSSHALLIAAGKTPPSPEHITKELHLEFVIKGLLDKKYVIWYRDLLSLHKDIAHGKIHDLKGVEIDKWQERAEEFLRVSAKLVNELISSSSS